MRHFPNRQVMMEALIELFEQFGAHILQRDGARVAVFLDDDPSAPMPVAIVPLDMLATELEKRLS